MGLPGSCPWGKLAGKVTCQKEKCTCPRRADGVFTEPWARFQTFLNISSNDQIFQIQFACKVCGKTLAQTAL